MDNISLQVPHRAFGLLRGASGSGKSTLLGILGALARPTSGRVFIGSQEITQASPHELARLRRRIGFVFQNFTLLDRLTAWENVAVPLIALGIPHRERRARATSLLTQLGLSQQVGAKVTELSGGEQQRIAAARALVGSPNILLADEPTANLDDESGEKLSSLLVGLHRQGLTILVASHDDRFADLATQMWTLKSGRLVGDTVP